MNVVKDKTTTMVYVINSGIENGESSIIGYIVLDTNTGKAKRVSKSNRATIKLPDGAQIVYLPPYICTRVHEKTLNSRIQASRKLQQTLNYFSIKGADPSVMYEIAGLTPSETLGLYCGPETFYKTTEERKQQISRLITACTSLLGIDLATTLNELQINYYWLNRR